MSGLQPHYGEHALFMGYIALAATFVGVGAMLPRPTGKRDSRRSEQEAMPRRAGEVWCVLALGTFAFVCSLGPAARGPESADWTPFSWFVSLPGMALFRAPARFALLVTLAMSVLAACGAAWWSPLA